MNPEIQMILDNADAEELKVIDLIKSSLDQAKGKKLDRFGQSVELSSIHRYVIEIESIQRLRQSVSPP